MILKCFLYQFYPLWSSWRDLHQSEPLPLVVLLLALQSLCRMGLWPAETVLVVPNNKKQLPGINQTSILSCFCYINKYIELLALLASEQAGPTFNSLLLAVNGRMYHCSKWWDVFWIFFTVSFFSPSYFNPPFQRISNVNVQSRQHSTSQSCLKLH